MNSKNYLTIENIIDYIRSSDKRKIGLICLNCIFNSCKIDELEDFIDKYQIKLPEKSTLTRLEYIKYLCLNFVKKFNDYSEIRNSYTDPLSLLGKLVISDNIFQKYIKKLDYIAKQDLINVFADFCADLGIIVYKIYSVFRFSISLFNNFIQSKAYIINYVCVNVFLAIEVIIYCAFTKFRSHSYFIKCCIPVTLLCKESDGGIHNGVSSERSLFLFSCQYLLMHCKNKKVTDNSYSKLFIHKYESKQKVIKFRGG